MTALPEYDIDLSAPPSERWTALITEYRQEILEVVKWYKKNNSTLTSGAIPKLAGFLNRSGSILHGQEIASIASTVGVKTGIVALLQFIYEINSCCTSVVTHYQESDRSLRPQHCRSMDWPLDILKRLSVVVRFVKNGQVLYRAVTWVGYVGILTAVSDSCSVAVNFRAGSSGSTVLDSLTNAASGYWPIGFLVRDAYESAYDYQKMVKVLAGTKLISPCYFTVVGRREGEGVIIARDPEGLACKMENLADKGFLIQTNHDNNGPVGSSRNILHSRERRKLTKDYLTQLPSFVRNKSMRPEELKHIFSLHPVLNSMTVYISYAAPHAGILEAQVGK